MVVGFLNSGTAGGGALTGAATAGVAGFAHACTGTDGGGIPLVDSAGVSGTRDFCGR
jgi:hypothetical protein